VGSPGLGPEMILSRHGRRFATVLAGASVLGATVLVPLPLHSPAAAARMSGRPNFVLITADDMRPSDLRAMPFTRRVLARRGVTFTDAIAPFPLCCPARASILTGQYAHNHGVRSNRWPNGSYWAFRHRDNTLPVWLRRQGYSTAMVGKFLAEYAKHKPAELVHRRLYEVPPGWTHWYALYGKVHSYAHLTLNVDTPKSRPHRITRDRYVTNFLTGITEDLIGTYHRTRRPFFIWLSQVAPHGTKNGGWNPPLPHPRDRGDFAGVRLARGPVYRSALNEDTSDKRGPMPSLPAVSLRRLRGLYQRRLESLKSLDRSVRRVVAQLKHTGEFGHTVIIFTSDNGYGMGEHRWVSKGMPHDAVLKIPMIISAPGLKHRYRPGAGLHQRVRVDESVTTIDIAPTIVGASGATAGRTPEGLNMLRPSQNPDHTPGGDRVVLIEAGPKTRFVSADAKFVGVRTDRWTWFGWHATVEGELLHLGGREFYDRRTLPSQVTNIEDPALFPGVRLRLSDLTQQMWNCKGSECIATWR
jgi:N-acetylglucosamine-6-sulfatase